MIRVRAGLRVSLPFGLFANCATFVFKVADLATVHERLKGEGSLLSAAALSPSREGRRLRITKKGRTVIDGPFTESKEMIGGFVIMEMPSMDAAVAYATEYAEILLLGQDAVELDIRVAR